MAIKLSKYAISMYNMSIFVIIWDFLLMKIYARFFRQDIFENFQQNHYFENYLLIRSSVC